MNKNISSTASTPEMRRWQAALYFTLIMALFEMIPGEDLGVVCKNLLNMGPRSEQLN